MKLDLKEWIAKTTDAEPKETLLSGTARLIRIGKFRTLVLNGYQTQENVVLPVGDRPDHQVEAVFWAGYDGRYWKSGNVTISTNGAIAAYVASNYNANAYQSTLGGSETIISTAIWVVP